MAAKRSDSRARDKDNYGPHRLYEDVLALAGTLLRDRKELGSKRLAEIADAVRDTARIIPEMPNLNAYATATADGLADFAEYVSESDLETMIADANLYARRYPVMTVGLAAAAGLFAMSYVKSGSAARRKTGVHRSAARRKASAKKPGLVIASGKKTANGAGRAADA